MPEVYDNMIKTLSEKEINYEVIDHEHVHTATDAAKARGLETPKEGVKSLIFKTGEGNFVLVLVRGDKKADTKKIKELEHTKNLFLASPEEVEKLAGVSIGSVGPFGLRTKFKTYIDESIKQVEWSYFSPGSHFKTVKIKSKDLFKILEDSIVF